MTDDRRKVIWKHNGDTTADIEIAQEPVVAKVFFCDHCIIINGVTIKLAILQQIVREYDEASKTASKMMEPPF